MAVLKKEFIDRMAENGGITKKAARLGFDLFVETLMNCMSEDEKVMISGFGRFEMKTTKERKG
ncbi:MAG: HU family DNA-binding protein, partial [Lachnospiraceae bacterium]|nr:HU family DNA-binding protein [Lachnospiraceae bacterium]